jgi:hypothetical protein
MMVFRVLYAMLLFAPAIIANTYTEVDNAQGMRACQTTATETDEDYIAFERPQLQAPFPGVSGVWRGLGLDKRQTTCTPKCATGTGCCSTSGICCPLGDICYAKLCCANDGSIPCINGCCPRDTICGANPTDDCPHAT